MGLQATRCIEVPISAHITLSRCVPPGPFNLERGTKGLCVLVSSLWLATFPLSTSSSQEQT